MTSSPTKGAFGIPNGVPPIYLLGYIPKNIVYVILPFPLKDSIYKLNIYTLKNCRRIKKILNNVTKNLLLKFKRRFFMILKLKNYW